MVNYVFDIPHSCVSIFEYLPYILASRPVLEFVIGFYGFPDDQICYVMHQKLDEEIEEARPDM